MNTSESFITAAHAIVLPVLSDVYSSVEYIKGTAIAIGADHIHSFYEGKDKVKIYLKDKKYVDTLVSSGIRVMGRLVNVDYAVPPGTTVILSDVEPVLPDNELIKHLSAYGSINSPIIHELKFEDVEYSHIKCGLRKLYMNIFDNSNLPSNLNFIYKGIYYQINVLVEGKEDAVEESHPSPETSEIQKNSKQSSPFVCQKQENLDSVVSFNTDQGLSNNEFIKAAKKSAIIIAARKNAKKRSLFMNIKRCSKRGRRRPGHNSYKIVTVSNSESEEEQHNTKQDGSASTSSFNKRYLNHFLKAVKYKKHNVREVADEFVSKKIFKSLDNLISQLKNYSVNCDIALNLRIGRVIKILSETSGK